MAVRTAPLQVRWEDWSVGSGDTVRTYYLYDPTSDKWLSTHTETITQGRNDNIVSGFMKSVNGTLLTNIHGPNIPHQATIIGLAATATNTPVNMEIRVYNNAGLVLSESWNGSSSVMYSTDEDVAASNLSTYIATVGTPSTKPSRPMIQLYLKWRL